LKEILRENIASAPRMMMPDYLATVLEHSATHRRRPSVSTVSNVAAITDEGFLHIRPPLHGVEIGGSLLIPSLDKAGIVLGKAVVPFYEEERV
jgi:hypothetical protein